MLLLLLWCLCIGCIEADNSYIVTAPNAVIPGAPLGFHVTILDASSDVTIRTALKYAANGSVVVETTGKATEGNPTLIELQIPESVQDSSYKVSVTGSGGLAFHKESNIFFDSANFLFIFAQTDKYRYSGGQTVQFRVIFLNPDLHGYKGAFDIAVKDPKDNKLKQWLAQTTDDGVFSGRFDLSDEPENGAWKIVASAKGKTEAHAFQVSPYTLPRFKVLIDVDNVIHSTESEIDLDVSARFTFKQPVIGTAVLQLYNKELSEKMIEYRKEIQGRVTFEIPIKDVRKKLDLRKTIVARAMVTDNATVLTMAAETPLNIIIDSQSITIKRWDKRNRFVPGITYFATFSVYSGQTRVLEAGNIGVRLYYTTYRLVDCPNTQHRRQRIEYATDRLFSYTGQNDDNGIFFLTANPPANAIKLKVKLYKGSDYIMSYELKRVLPAHRSKMIRLSLLSPADVGETAKLHLSATTTLRGSVIFEVYSRGRLLDHQAKKVNGVKSANFQFIVLRNMIPKANILAYYIDNDGTVTSDQITFSIEGSRMENSVSVRYDRETVEARENVQLTIEASPGSIVYLLAEDERNRLLGTGNDVYQYQVEQKWDNTSFGFESNIKNYPTNTGKKRRAISTFGHSKRNFDAYGDTDDAFMEAGVIFFTDTRMLETSNIGNDYTDHYKISCPVRRIPSFSKVLVPLAHLSGGGPTLSLHAAARPFGSSNSISQNAGSRPNDSSKPGGKIPSEVLVRSLFPETWFWDSVKIGPEGSATVTKLVQDSVTSWVTSAFATNDNMGFGVAKDKPKLTVFRDFFVTLDMPATIIFGEEFLLQVTVFNYLRDTQQVVLGITHSDDPNDVKPEATTVAAGEGHSVFAYIKPVEHGDIKVTVRAQAGLFWVLAQDIIERKIYVQPAGVWHESNIPQMIDVSSTKFTKTFNIEDYENMVPNTKVLKVSFAGDFMLPSVQSIEGLQDFLRLPTGCGEQTMILMAPNVYITEYLKVAGKLTDDIMDKSKALMVSGLQRELKYQRQDGSYSAWGDTDPSGSSWLTAFVLKCFGEAKDLIFIDENIIITAMEWLLTKQKNTGEFMEPGNVIHREMQSGTNTDIKLTSFILISLMENQEMQVPNPAGLQQAIAKGIGYIEDNLRSVKDTYSLALVCYVLSMGESRKTGACESKLSQTAISEDDTLHWKSNTPATLSKRNIVKRAANSRAPAKDIEATAYALLFYLSREKLVESYQIVKWLVSQRNSRGGYLSTQDTVISLQAISTYATFTANERPDDDFGIDFKITSGDYEYAYSLNANRKDLLHVHELPPSLRDVTIEADGKGSALIEIFSGYFVSELPSSDLLGVTADIIKESLSSITVKICLRWNDGDQSGMIVSEVEMPTGFFPDEDRLKSQNDIKRHEHKGKVVNLYFDGLSAGGQVCVDVKSDRVDPIVKSQACHVMVYDYYEPENQAMAIYESGLLKRSNICDVCIDCNICENDILIG